MGEKSNPTDVQAFVQPLCMRDQPISEAGDLKILLMT